MAISQKSADFFLRSRMADAEAGSVEALYELGVSLFDGARRNLGRPDRSSQMVQPRGAVGRHPQPGVPGGNLDRDDRA